LTPAPFLYMICQKFVCAVSLLSLEIEGRDLMEIMCSICGRMINLSGGCSGKDNMTAPEGFYHYEDRIICINCWDDAKIKGKIEGFQANSGWNQAF